MSVDNFPACESRPPRGMPSAFLFLAACVRNRRNPCTALVEKGIAAWRKTAHATGP